jgi:hypothetical protein
MLPPRPLGPYRGLQMGNGDAIVRSPAPKIRDRFRSATNSGGRCASVGSKLELRPHKEDLHDISSFRNARDRYRFNLNDFPILARPFHHLAFREFGHDLVIVEFFLALNAVVEVHDVFHG